ncbi:homoserine dehydrogenase [Agrilactobacillus yilanensis]|uniref:Homoserine dehydrogenase n=1 Tax=Agrilactobacillus yilanensis TaxID=2485997 RepID=A0ABW4JA58_9LACO|nr:homoserine dehydrogenase [Agrilactobacillus yilanensis]
MEQIKIGMLGLGTVGSGVVQIIQEHQEKISQITGRHLEVKRVAVRNVAAHKDEFKDIELTTDVNAVLNDPEIPIIVEVMGSIQPAMDYIVQALENGKNVVTANKDLIAQHGSELVKIAKKNNVDLVYEASVAGGIPILRTIVNSFAADQIEDVKGIVNGTTNYIMTQMVTKGMTYQAALKSAQELGFAESDPTNDVEGIDAAYKMIILTQFAYGTNVKLSDLTVEGISKIDAADIKQARTMGYTMKLVGESAEINGQLAVSVAPALVPLEHPLATIQNENNAVLVKGAAVGTTMFVGPGAGKMPTANSVLSDIIAVTKNIILGTTGNTFNGYRQKAELATPDMVVAPYYLALKIPDIPGQLLKLTHILTEADTSVKQVVQTETDGEYARVVVITHKTSLAKLQEIQKEIKADGAISLISCYKVLEASK